MCVVIHNSNIDLGSNSNSNLLILKVHLTCTCMCVVIHNSNIDLGSNSNSNLLILKVIVIVIHYIDLRGNSNMLHCIVIDPHVCIDIELYTIVHVRVLSYSIIMH